MQKDSSTVSDEQIPLQPAAITLAEYFRRWGVVLAPFFGVTVMVWAFHHFWHRFDPVIFVFLWLPTGATRIFFSYLRQFHPERFPSMLSEDSEELAKLKCKKMLLNRIGWGGMGSCILLGLTIRLFSGVHPGEVCYLVPDVLWPWIALPIVVSCGSLFWRDVLGAHIRERTPHAARPVKTSRSRRSPTVISGRPFQGNGFRSDHWGESVSNKQVQVFSSEKRDREGYSRRPQTQGENPLWEAEAVWPAQ
jgi:hypothetical protein